MPRKPKLEKKTITVVVNGTPVAVSLHPPTKTRKSWYAYWAGLVTSKSTGHHNLEDAILAAENMVKNGGKRADVQGAILSNEEFEQIQKAHFSKKMDPTERARADKSLKACPEAISAFRDISGLRMIALANADDCASFQRKALLLPKNWRHKYPKSKKEVECLSANTVLKWSGALQAAFERANKNAPKRKCIRGVVDERKLLNDNPWNHFPWIQGRQRPIRQFDANELLSFLDYLEKRWSGVTVAAALAKLCLWSSGRRAELVGLDWNSLRVVGNEYHFDIVGKAGVEKWFRVPEGLYHELDQVRTESPFVFAAYREQVRQFYERSHRPGIAKIVRTEFNPVCLGDWFHGRIVDWSKSLPNGSATPHILRKTSLQYARRGEDVNRQVAGDARVSEGVMMTNYVKETDEELRQASNRTFHRILGSLPPAVARAYGYMESRPSEPEQLLKTAITNRDWSMVAQLSTQLANQERPPTG